MKPRSFFPILLVVGCAAVALWADRASLQPSDIPNPADARIEYRPGAFFPPGFPLHGTVKLLSEPVVEMGKRHRVRIEYTLGDQGVGEGESVEIWKHFTSDVEEFQVTDPDEPAFFGVETSATGVELKTKIFVNSVQRNSMGVFPYRKTAGATVTKGALKKGDKVYFELGGKQGVRMQYYSENLFNFRVVLVDPEAKTVLGYGGDAYMKVIGGPLDTLKVQAPSIVGLREPFSVEVVPIDSWGSLAKDFQGLELEMVSDQAGLSPFEYDADLMHYVAPNVVANQAGVVRIRVRTKDGRFEGMSNPVWVESHANMRVYYGDLHQHTYLHDGRGVPMELYLNARRVALLDFGSLTPHQGPLAVTGPNFVNPELRRPRNFWPDLIDGVKRMKGWKGFTPILGYEYSVGTAAGGHHNVIYADDEAPTTMDLDPGSWREPVGKMMQILRRGQKRALVIPHIGGGPPDWQHPTDQRMERLFEIASVHGVFEESYRRHLESGQRLAATASGDVHTVGFGNANPGLIYTMTNPLTAVYSYTRDREDLWAGLFERRTFGVTGNKRLLMDFSVNDEQMGGEIALGHSDGANIEARVSGTDSILRVDLIKNSQVLHSVFPARRTSSDLLRVKWGDNWYQRRANISMTNGSLRPSGGRILLKETLALDNSFERLGQQGSDVTWRTSSTSNDRDGVLIDISGVTGDSIAFELSDQTGLGTTQVEIPLADLRKDGVFGWTGDPKDIKHSYMEKMGVPIRFFLEAELVAPDAAMDVDFAYQDRGELKSGDYYYLRVEQVDTIKAWSSPVWVN